MGAPSALGRGVVVRSGQAAPDAWRDVARVVVDDRTLAEPTVSAAVVERLHAAWLAREPVVVELACDPAALREPERHDGPVYTLDPGFELVRDRLQFLVWANNYDGRGDDLIWWHGRKAARAVPGAQDGGPADLCTGAGVPLFVDGGPPDPPALDTGGLAVHRWSAEAGDLTPTAHDAPAGVLAPDQRAAVGHPTGAARVLAPAGSGKTRVLTERVRHLVADRHAHPSTITALAYNTRAADELRDRCGVARGTAGPHVRTLNAMGLWICSELGGEGRLEVLDERATRDLVQTVFPVPRQANADTVAPYLDALSAVRLGLAPPAVVEGSVPDAAGLADWFDAFRDALRRRHAVDFDEQIYLAIEVLLRNPDARTRAQRSCRRLLVDEFQDLTPAHLLLLRLVSAPGYDCFAVGDDDQVIYGYSGATPDFLIHFGRYFPGAGSHPLEVNYRCPEPVVDAARTLLSYNHRRVEKQIVAGAPATVGIADGGAPATVGEVRAGSAGRMAVQLAPSAQLAHVAVDVLQCWLADGTALDDIAVLARVNAALLPVHVACLEAGVPVSSTLGPSVLRRTGIRTALAYLRIAADPDQIRRDDLLDTVRRPPRRIARNVVEMLTRRATSSVREITRLAGVLSGGDVPKLLDFVQDLEQVAAASTTVDALRTIRLSVGLGTSVDALDASRGDADRSTHVDDLLALEAVASLHPDVGSFESWLTEMLTRRTGNGSAVLLSTVHKVKGKEWPRVIVFGATNGLFPHRLGDDVEGERRVFHVALTRCRTRVVVLADQESPSPFVSELDGSRPRDAPVAPAAASSPRASSRRPERPSSPSGAAPVVRALRSWRLETARRDKVPAYVVMSDADLDGVAAAAPRTLEGLRACRGMGPVRLERYGDDILRVIEEAASAS